MRILMVLYYTVYMSVWVPCVARETVYMDEMCGETHYISSAPDIRVKLTRGSSYRAKMDCKFTLYGTYNSEDKLMLNFQDNFGMCCSDYSGCTSDWLEIHAGRNIRGQHIGETQYCGFNTPNDIYTSPENAVTFWFKSDNSTESTGFNVLVTHYADATEFCNTGETECNNGRCIDSSLACNGDNPCGDYSDCYTGGGDDGSFDSDVDVVGAIIGISVGATVGFILIVTTISVICCVLCKQKRNRARRQRQGRVIMTTAPVATVGSPQQHVYGQPQCHVNIPTGPVTSYPAKNTTSFPANKPTTSDYM